MKPDIDSDIIVDDTVTESSERLTLQYLGRKEKMVLNLNFLSEKGIEFTPGGTNTILKSDAAKLIRENPRMFKVVMPGYDEKPAETVDQGDKTDEGNALKLDDIRALLEALPNKKAICDYCKTEYGIDLDASLKKDALLDEAVREIQDTFNFKA